MARVAPLFAAVCSAFVLAAPLAVAAQGFPSKTVRIVIGVPPGGLSDTLARGLAGELSKTWGQSVIVENRPGAPTSSLPKPSPNRWRTDTSSTRPTAPSFSSTSCCARTCPSKPTRLSLPSSAW